MGHWSGSSSPSQSGLNVRGTQILRGASRAGLQLTSERVSQGPGPCVVEICPGKSSASTKSPRACVCGAAAPPPTPGWRGKAGVLGPPASFELDRTSRPGSDSPEGARWFQGGWQVRPGLGRGCRGPTQSCAIAFPPNSFMFGQRCLRAGRPPGHEENIHQCKTIP